MDNKQYTQLVKENLFSTDNLVPLDVPFVDVRGSIQNLITNGVESVAVIESKKGSIRSNHWHKDNSHYLYIVSGEIKYSERDLDGSNRKEDIYKSGQMIFTGPNKVHKVEMLSDTIMISLAPKSNAPEDHNQDTVKCEY